MTANRIGVSPLEEALLALVLAGEGAGSSPALPGRALLASDRAANAGADDADAGAVLVPDGAAGAASAGLSLGPGETVAVLVLDGAASAASAGLSLRPGETVALLGPPGAGKRALLSEALARHPSASLAAPSAAGGRAAVEALGSPDEELATESTVRENLELRLRVAGSEAGADALLEHAALGERAGVLVADLEPGDHRRLAIACALAGDPELLVLDEPSAGLSAVDRETVWQLLARRRADGGATLLATTSVQDALCVCDRAALVRDGAIVAVATPAQLADEHFPPSSLHVRVSEEPDRALLEDLPEVSDVRIDERVDHWVVELRARQPQELRALLRADPEFPEIAGVPGDDG